MKKSLCTIFALLLTFSMLFSSVVGAAGFDTESWGNGYYNVDMSVDAGVLSMTIKGVVKNETDFDKLYADLACNVVTDEGDVSLDLLINDGKIYVPKGDIYCLIASSFDNADAVFADYKDNSDYVMLFDKSMLEQYLGVDVTSLTQIPQDDVKEQVRAALETSKESFEQLGFSISDDEIERIAFTTESIVDDFGNYLDESGCLDGIFTSTDDKITLKLDEKSLVHAISTFMNYAVSHRAEMTEKIKGYCDNLSGISSDLDITLADLPNQFNKAIIEYTASKLLNIDMESQLLSQLGGVTFNLDFEMDNKNCSFKLLLNAQTPDGIEASFKYDITKATSVNEKTVKNAANILDELDEKYKKAKLDVLQTQIIWGAYDDSKENSVNVTYQTDNGELPIVYSFYNVDGSIYLPLRSICETNGEQVTWDDDAKQAYVNDVPMAGIIRNDKTYVKVRDFEKLGYTVDYMEGNGMHVASISKN